MVLVYLCGVKRLLGNGNADGEGGSAAFLAVEVDAAAMQEHQFARQSQTEACTNGVLLAVGTVMEPAEQFFLLLLGYANAVVAYLNNNMVELLVGVYLQHHLAVGA